MCKNICSDYYFISYAFKFGGGLLIDSLPEHYEYVDGRFIWNAKFTDEHVNRLNDTSIVQQLNEINDTFSSCTDQNVVKSCFKGDRVHF